MLGLGLVGCCWGGVIYNHESTSRGSWHRNRVFVRTHHDSGASFSSELTDSSSDDESIFYKKNGVSRSIFQKLLK